MPEKLIGKKWDANDRQAWLNKQRIQRSYTDDVVSKIELLRKSFEVDTYGSLDYSPQHYPLFGLKTRSWLESKPTVLITGGVHGYETSGVHGALRFLEANALDYAKDFNLAVAPCVSPWGYETINRWNPSAIDPNRSFYKSSPAAESALLMTWAQSLISEDTNLLAHVDLHETTDTDNTIFRPALAKRDGIQQAIWNIPDGFYLVGNIDKPVDAFQRAVINSVKKVTHIAQPDSEGKIIGEPVVQEGVINYATKKLGLCTGFSDSQYSTTTEVYPDSPLVTDEECIVAQVAAINGGLNYLKKIHA